MRKLLLLILAFVIFSTASMAQDYVRPASLGVSFFLNDFQSAQRIRSGTFEQVLRDKKFSKFDDMDPGLAVTYFKGVHPNVDVAATLAGSYTKYPINNKISSKREALLLEADASLNLKMFPDKFWVNPYLIAGVGASKYKDYYGAFAPLGGGVKVNFTPMATLFVTAQYRVGITKETTNYHFLYSVGFAGSLHN